MMLEGKVCIDIHNHKSGFMERIEGKNAITDGLANYVKYAITSGYNISDILPIATQVLGGICLINQNFSGNGDIYIPPSAQYIGGGAYNFVDTNSKYVGSYNQLESGWNESTHTFTHIYDFTTSQANGDIGGIGLTTIKGGKHFYEQKTELNSYYTYNPNVPYPIVYVDLDNDEIYYVKGNTSSEHVYKTKYSLTALSLNQINRVINQSGEVDTEKTLDCSHLSRLNQWHDGNDGSIYLGYVENDKLHIKVVDVSTWTEDTEEIYDFPSSLCPHGFGITADYIYVISSDHKYIYRYKKSDDTIGTYDIEQMFGTGYIVKHISELPGGGIYGSVYDGISSYSSGTYYFRINASNVLDYEGISYTSDYDYYPLILGNGLGYYEFNGLPNIASLNPQASVLMSNYNLPSIISKTNTQSMRITYSITQV